MSSRDELFARIPVRSAVLKQILPAIASQMITLIYNLADTYFVGLLNDPAQTAAITVVGVAYPMLNAISNLFGVGGASALARALGRKEPEQARRIAALTFWGGLGLSLLFSALFAVFSTPLLTLCGATADTLALAEGYARWVVVYGGPCTALNILLANLVRAEGSAGYASTALSAGGILNILLDPFFVLPQFLGMGAVGAGLATALSNMAVTVIFLAYLALRRHTTVLSIAPHHLHYARQYLWEVLSIGFPSALQLGLTVVAVSAQMNFISAYPTEAMAAFGIVKKLDQLPLYVSIGVANGLLPLLAYNHAAGNHRRRRDAFRFGVSISLGFSLLCLVCYEIFAPQLSALFISDPLTIHYSAGFLRCMVTAMPMMSVCYPMIIQFQAMGRVRESLISSILRKGALDIPLLFLMDSLLPLYGCMWVQPIVDAVSLVVVLWFYRRIQRQLPQ